MLFGILRIKDYSKVAHKTFFSLISKLKNVKSYRKCKKAQTETYSVDERNIETECSEGEAEDGTLVLPMPGGGALLEMGGGLAGEGGRHRWTPTLHSMSSSIFLFGPFVLTKKTHTHTHARKWS